VLDLTKDALQIKRATAVQIFVTINVHLA